MFAQQHQLYNKSSCNSYCFIMTANSHLTENIIQSKFINETQF